MSSTTTPTSDRHPYLQFLELPAAAGTAVAPCFTGWVYKSADQLHKARPPLMNAVKIGFTQGAPAVAAVIGGQLLLQEKVEAQLGKIMTPGTTPFALTSSAVVGVGTSPLLAIYNGKTMGMSMLDSVKSMNARIVVAIATRETGFLASLRVVPENNYFLSFLGAAGASILTHPADTAHTLWQRDLTIEGTATKYYGSANAKSITRVLFAGWKPRSLGVGAFAACIKATKSFFCTPCKKEAW